ncbi:MAG: zinc ribbon domain-containing protein [bacterium]|nr:MAG: zinc ribbon domain-containing protein [bacterium]
MPTYEYRCDTCRKDFEVFQKITDNPLEKCPECGGRVQRLIAASNFILKGGGWHKTEYASGGSAAEKEAAPCGADKNKPACQTCPANTDS